MIRDIDPPPEPSLPLVIELVPDPVDAAESRVRREYFARNISWYEAHALEIGEKCRGKHICIAGQELFVADTSEESLALARAAHPEDRAPFFKYVYRERMPRIYAYRGPVAAL